MCSVREDDPNKAGNYTIGYVRDSCCFYTDKFAQGNNDVFQLMSQPTDYSLQTKKLLRFLATQIKAPKVYEITVKRNQNLL